eukprot:scaffold132437_cov21-Tisochrysis_lutea.AAC.1
MFVRCDTQCGGAELTSEASSIKNHWRQLLFFNGTLSAVPSALKLQKLEKLGHECRWLANTLTCQRICHRIFGLLEWAAHPASAPAANWPSYPSLCPMHACTHPGGLQ